MFLGTLHLAKVHSLFMQRYPKLNVELSFNDKVVDLIREGYDLATRISELPDSSLIARKLSPCHSRLYAAKYASPQNVADLKGYNCLCYSFTKPGKSGYLTKKGKNIAISKRVFSCQ